MHHVPLVHQIRLSFFFNPYMLLAMCSISLRVCIAEARPVAGADVLFFCILSLLQYIASPLNSRQVDQIDHHINCILPHALIPQSTRDSYPSRHVYGPGLGSCGASYWLNREW